MYHGYFSLVLFFCGQVQPYLTNDLINEFHKLSDLLFIPENLFNKLTSDVQTKLYNSVNNLIAVLSLSVLSSENFRGEEEDTFINIIKSLNEKKELLVNHSEEKVQAIGWAFRSIILNYSLIFPRRLNEEMNARMEEIKKSIIQQEKTASLKKLPSSSSQTKPSFFTKKDNNQKDDAFSFATEQISGLPNRQHFSSELKKCLVKGGWSLKLSENDRKDQYTIQSIDNKGVTHRNRNVQVTAGKVSAILIPGDHDHDYIEHMAAVMVHVAIISGICLNSIKVHCVNEKMNNALHAEINRCKIVHGDEMNSTNAAPSFK